MQTLDMTNFSDHELEDVTSHARHALVDEVIEEGVVSFQSELPLALQSAMTSFLEIYPNWDQYRLIQAALAGFLVQNGVESRSITRLYIGNMFRNDSLICENN